MRGLQTTGDKAMSETSEVPLKSAALAEFQATEERIDRAITAIEKIEELHPTPDGSRGIRERLNRKLVFVRYAIKAIQAYDEPQETK
jgi:hypothetical protein